MSRLNQRIENFTKALNIYKEAVAEYKKNKTKILIHMALIQTFEVTFELGWKVLKDYLAEKDLFVYTPRDVIKEAFAANIIPDGQLWIDMARDRNVSSHEYNTDKINTVLNTISTNYFNELCRFEGWTKKINE
ncbi:nucleotidyltransferase substrate binding protein [bacterium]|nr:nucleotidyltransferase substrate binding protein [bacterium]